MSQAQDAILGNLLNGIVATLANRYVTNVMIADPETKLLVFLASADVRFS